MTPRQARWQAAAIDRLKFSTPTVLELAVAVGVSVDTANRWIVAWARQGKVAPLPTERRPGKAGVRPFRWRWAELMPWPKDTPGGTA